MAVYQLLVINLFSNYIELEVGKCPKHKSESLNSISPSKVFFACVVKGI